MTNRDLFRLHQALGLVSDLPGAKFAYAVAKNKSRIDSVINALQKTKRHAKEEEYERRRIETCDKFCDKDKDGNPVIENGAFQGLQGNTDFDAAIDILNTEFKSLIDYRKKEKEAFNAKLDENTEIKIHKVIFKDIPEAITANQLEGIMPIVLDPV